MIWTLRPGLRCRCGDSFTGTVYALIYPRRAEKRLSSDWANAKVQSTFRFVMTQRIFQPLHYSI